MSKQNPNPPPAGENPPANPPPADDNAAKKPTELSRRKLADGTIVRVLTDGIRTWKDAPADSGMEPLK